MLHDLQILVWKGPLRGSHITLDGDGRSNGPFRQIAERYGLWIWMRVLFRQDSGDPRGAQQVMILLAKLFIDDLALQGCLLLVQRLLLGLKVLQRLPHHLVLFTQSLDIILSLLQIEHEFPAIIASPSITSSIQHVNQNIHVCGWMDGWMDTHLHFLDQTGSRVKVIQVLSLVFLAQQGLELFACPESAEILLDQHGLFRLEDMVAAANVVTPCLLGGHCGMVIGQSVGL
jgi:hypothetical protein